MLRDNFLLKTGRTMTCQPGRCKRNTWQTFNSLLIRKQVDVIVGKKSKSQNIDGIRIAGGFAMDIELASFHKEGEK